MYENKDNKHGPNSRKVKMTRMRKKAKPPGAPVIVSHGPQSPSAIHFTWKYNLQAAPIEGYFIFYRDTTMAGEYSKVGTLRGALWYHADGIRGWIQGNGDNQMWGKCDSPQQTFA